MIIDFLEDLGHVEWPRDYVAALTKDSTIQTASEVSLVVDKIDMAKHAPSLICLHVTFLANIAIISGPSA